MVKGQYRVVEVSYLAPRKSVGAALNKKYYMWLILPTGIEEFQTDDFSFERPIKFKKSIQVSEHRVLSILQPLSPLNPNKRAGTSAIILAEGIVNIIENNDDFKYGSFNGLLNGLYKLKKESIDDTWLLKKSDLLGQKMISNVYLKEQRLKIFNQQLKNRKSKFQEIKKKEKVNFNELVSDTLNELVQELESIQESKRPEQNQNLSVKLMVKEELRKGDKIEIPLEVTGIAITEGTHKLGVFYSKEEIEYASDKLINTVIYLDHNTDGVMQRVGKVVEAWYNPLIKGIEFNGWIEDERVASKIYHGLIDSVSVGIRYQSVPTETGLVLAKNLNFKEISLVREPADINAKIGIR